MEILNWPSTQVTEDRILLLPTLTPQNSDRSNHYALPSLKVHF